MTEYPEDNYPFDNLAKELAHQLHQQYIAQCEATLENLIRSDMVEVLTDKRGQFTYRMTKHGKKVYEEKTGVPAPNTDLTFHELFPLR